MTNTIKPISYSYDCTPQNLFEELCDSNKVRKWFPEFFIAQPDIQPDLQKLRKNGIQYIAKIHQTMPYSNISGTIESINNTIDKLHFEWTLEQNPDVRNWTRLSMKFTEPIQVQCSRWWAPLIVVTGGGFMALFEGGLMNVQNAYASGTTNTIISKSASVSTSSKGGIASTSSLKIAGIIAILAVAGTFGSVYANRSNALFEMENLITIANVQYHNRQYEESFGTFSKVDQIFLSTVLSPDHIEHAEYLHLQSLMGMGNSLQSQSDFGQIKSFSEKSEEYYLYALAFYEGKHEGTDNAWIGRAINAIYETPEKTLEICSLFDSVNSHMCQGEAYSYMYVIEKAPLEKAEKQFEMALDLLHKQSHHPRPFHSSCV